MTKSRPIIVCILLCICFWLYLFKGCGKSGPDHSGDKKSVDSMVEKAIQDSVKWGVMRDSIFKVVRSLQNTKDSQTAVIASYKTDIRTKGRDIQGLLDELDKAESDHDTADFISGCDSLRNEFASAKGLVGRYIIANDSLTNLNTRIIGQKDTIIARLSGLYNEANNGLFDFSRRFNNLYADYKKLNVRPKRFGVGPFAGAAFAGGKVVGTVGIGVQYNLIKF